MLSLARAITLQDAMQIARQQKNSANMNGLRIWHIMALVGATAVLFTVARFDIPCTPLTPILALLYLCGLLGIQGARWQGKRWHTGLWLGLLLGPLGVILAWSNPVPERFKPAKNVEQGRDRVG
jgi:hypothetical protein